MKKLEKQLIKAQRRLDKLKDQAERIKFDVSGKDLARYCDDPENVNLRMKPAQPKIGDICKFWKYDKESFSIGKLASIDGVYYKYLNINNEKYYMNCQPLDPNMTLGEVFGKEVSND